MLVACGGGSDGNGSGAVAGSVVAVFNRLAMIDGERAAGGDSIRPGGLLSTDRGGAATFSAGKKLDACQIRPESAARLMPQPGVLLHYEHGWNHCRSAAGDSDTSS